MVFIWAKFEKGKNLFEVNLLEKFTLSFEWVVFFKETQIICRQSGPALKQDLSDTQH